MTRSDVAILVLEDGAVFHGRRFGAGGEAIGRLVMSTDSVDYQGVLTDPDNAGAVVLEAFPHIGTTGWDATTRHEITAAGVIVRDPSRIVSNPQATSSLAEALEAQSVVGIADIDTRELAVRLRRAGTARVAISTVTDDAEALTARLTAAKENH